LQRDAFGAWTLRIARPMRCAAWNMVGAFNRVSNLAGVRIFKPFGQVDSTDWLIARLPALAIAMMRWPGFEKICSCERSRHCRGRHWFGCPRS